MKRKSSAVVLLAVAALTVNSALPGQAAAKKAKDVKIAAVVKGLDNPFFISIKEGIEETALKYGIRANVQAAPGLNDDVGQANKLDSLAGQNYDCYIVIPISSNNLSQAVGKITKKKKTVINIDSPIDATSLAAAGGKVSSFAGTDTRWSTSAVTIADGVATSYVYAPANDFSVSWKTVGTAGTATAPLAATLTGATSTVATTVSNPTLTAAAAAIDAAQEATDAANAAYDAANNAMDSADAATAAAQEASDNAAAALAAVTELATTVANLVAKVNSMAATIAKIAKKVKA